MSGSIPQDFIDEVVARTDLVALIDRRVPLKKAGKDHTARCPFHDEKSPSFTVSADKQFYHCFGCGAHGNAIGFLMAFERLEFRDAVAELAGQVGLELPAGGEGPVPRHKELLDILEAAARFYRQQLREQPKAIDYLKQRGLSSAIAASFSLGYAPAGWDSLLQHLGRAPERRTLLLETGLLIAREGDSNSLYDRFRDRIIFPIRDSRGRVIGFGGRILDQGQPKYLNSPETPLFHKGRELYGLYEARQAQRELPWVLVVEGYMDVLMLAEHGIANAVATLGTATTSDHLRRLFRHTSRVVFCFDGDRAGRDAAARALQTSLPEMQDGREAAFLFLPEGEDPDSLVRREGRDTFLARTNQAQPLSDFLLQRLRDQVDLHTLEGRARLLERARPALKAIPQGAFRTLLEQSLARLAGMEPADLMRMQRGKAPSSPRPRPAVVHPTPVQRLMGLILAHPAAVHWVDPLLLPLLQAGDTEAQWLLALIELAGARPHLKSGGILEGFRDHPAEPLLAQLLIWQPDRAEEGIARECRDICQHLLQQQARGQIDALLDKAAVQGLDAEEKEQLRVLLSRRGG